FDKESWTTQAQILAEAGFRVVAIDFRGRGRSRGGPQAESIDDGTHYDVLAAIHYLQQTGASTVSLVGASFGGSASASAAIALPNQIDRIVLLAASIDEPEKLTGRKL